MKIGEYGEVNTFQNLEAGSVFISGENRSGKYTSTICMKCYTVTESPSNEPGIPYCKKDFYFLILNPLDMNGVDESSPKSPFLQKIGTATEETVLDISKISEFSFRFSKVNPLPLEILHNSQNPPGSVIANSTGEFLKVLLFWETRYLDMLVNLRTGEILDPQRLDMIEIRGGFLFTEWAIRIQNAGENPIKTIEFSASGHVKSLALSSAA